ncbi:Clan SB, family S8, subtilisin-like serine peptidase [Histomonas meleagridis]|uniref:Clan SB, family S8, subtilisin-like serine peptidase n=1 Tax=Histomonas meleagridis TaxID=135588 RepID=UPI00355944EC|nr:Clan SB, family S8, subtilisin-like serine peptidase [Histomonas meleagridis]KAH0804004.1 Clan SB, family S8, subtilisin-like serine peptidase [Histomonas meleagridis]
MQSGDDNLFMFNGVVKSNQLQNNRGLDGSGVVVTLIDSGVDVDHVFFRDSKNSVVYNEVNPKHRKIYKYATIADGLDKNAGHGTSTGGIISGSTQSDIAINLYHGHAPESKLSVIDIAYDDWGTMIFYPDLLSAAAENSTLINSRIISCSWGIVNPDTTLLQLFGEVNSCYEDVLWVCASGNDGKALNVLNVFPAGNKNALTVGASTQPWSASVEDSNYRQTYIEVGEYKIPVSSSNVFTLMKSDPMLSYTDLIITDTTNLYNTSDVNNQILFFESDGAYQERFFSLLKFEKPIVLVITDRTISMNSNIVVLTVSTVYSQYIPIGEKASISFSSSSIRVEDGKVELASFSNRGPSSQGLLKPELVAPGEIIYSSKAGITASDSTCISSSYGTSVSAPAVSGALALLVQYIEQKYPQMYQKHFGTTLNLVSHSHLLKAFIIQSSEYLNNASTSPNYNSGFGVPNLANVIVLDDSYQYPPINESGIYFNSTTIETIQHHTYQIHIDTSNPLRDLRVTISWNDPYFENGLFADLDLLIETPNHDVIYGNMYANNIEDSISTIEKIVIPKEDVVKGTYTIHIYSNRFPSQATINYSIVVNGPFPLFGMKSFEHMKSKMCINQCNNNGKCIRNGICKCNPKFTGINCQIPILELTKNQFYTFQVSPINSLYLLINLTNVNSKYIVINSTLNINNGNKLVTFIINKDNDDKMTRPKYTINQQDNDKKLMFIAKSGIDDDGTAVYVYVKEDSERSGLHTIQWFTTDSEPDQFTVEVNTYENVSKFTYIVLISLILFLVIVICVIVFRNFVKKEFVNEIKERILPQRQQQQIQQEEENV